jgi:hypothetical protein
VHAGGGADMSALEPLEVLMTSLCHFMGAGLLDGRRN